MGKPIVGAARLRGVAALLLLLAVAAAAAPARLTEGRRLRERNGWWDTATADCRAMRNCRRCNWWQGCTSCSAGYRRVQGNDGLYKCQKNKGAEAPPEQQPPVVQPTPTVPTPPPVTVTPIPLLPTPSPSPPTPAVLPPPAATPPVTPPASTNSACGVILNNVDLFGADLAVGTVDGATSWDFCCSACAAAPECGSFTWVPIQKRCYLKRSSGWGMKQVTNMQSAIMPGRNDSAGRNPTPTPAVPPPVVPPPVVPAPPAVVVPSPAPPSTTPKPDPPTQQTPGYPRINHGLLADGSEPTVLESLGTSRSTYHYYHPEYRVSTLYCADAFADKSEEWLLAYPWVAYCAPYLGGMSQANCGKCLRMTNQRTKAQIIVRIADMCGHGAIDADQQTAFIPLDTDNQGYLDGSMQVALELVAC